MHSTRILGRGIAALTALTALAAGPVHGATAGSADLTADLMGSGSIGTASSDTAADRGPAAAGRAGKDCTVPTGTSQVDVELDGVAYPVRVHVPDVDGRAAALPMVLNLHPSNGNAESISAYNDLDLTADAEGFITVAPNGVLPAADPNPDQVWFWNVPGVPTTAGEYPPPDTRDDVEFLTAVIDTMVGLGCADPHRVYATGHSGGARMASAYACARPDKVAAIAPVAGLRAGRPSPDDPSAVELQSCAPRRSVPVITFHGDADTVNPYQGNNDKRWGYTTQLAVQSWARMNGCTTGPRVEPVTEHVTKETYTTCRGRADVVLYKVTGGTHSWPGGNDSSATQEVSATELIWEFFTHYRR
jgi:polyhydroxybutyrate depolymerase